MSELPRLSEDPRSPFTRVLAALFQLEPSPAWFARGRLQSRLAITLNIPLHPEVSSIVDALIEQGALSVRWRHSPDGRRMTLLVDRHQLRETFSDFDPTEHQAPRLVVKPFATPTPPSANHHTDQEARP